MITRERYRVRMGEVRRTALEIRRYGGIVVDASPALGPDYRTHVVLTATWVD